MTPYADINFFFGKYDPGRTRAIDPDTFELYAIKATQYIKAYTGSNIDERNVPECVMMCCCEISEMLYWSGKAENESGGVKSESVGGWSKTYDTSSERTADLNQKIHSCICRWLSGTGLLYRGVRRC